MIFQAFFEGKLGKTAGQQGSRAAEQRRAVVKVESEGTALALEGSPVCTRVNVPWE